ncbi:phosphoribosylformylglycinamidine cyclo-ligase [bacterium]|nr:phosphoribosylformylglycinamidine cyclo-ligase [bacterium]
MSENSILKQSGVDIELGNYCSQIAQIETQNSVINQFSSAININKLEYLFKNRDLSNLIAFSSDGIGTKIEIAERLQIYNTIGIDLVAMIVDDLVSNGYQTISLTNILDVDYLDPKIVSELMKGLKEGAEFSNATINGGEIAELGNRVNGYGSQMHINWSGTGLGVLIPPLKKPIYGTDIKPGDKIVALKSSGFRSNGFSLLRTILKERFGDYWHLESYEGKSWGEILLTPSKIYTPFISNIIQLEFIPKGISHITGGGVSSKLKRVLPYGLGAKLDNLWNPFNFMNEILKLGNISLQKGYSYWNMGNGMLLICDELVANSIVEYSKNSYVDAKIAGIITDSGKIEINYNSSTFIY